MDESDHPSSDQEPPSRKRLILRTVGAAVAAAAIGTAAFGSISSAAQGDDLRSSMTLIAPAAAGGGWDAVAREMQQAQRANGIVNNAQVVNMPGAGGTIALNNLALLDGEPSNILVGGTGLLAATIQYDSAVTLDDVTPLAVAVDEYDVIVVPADSPYEELDDLMEAWAENPGAVPWTGGGSFDQLVVTEMALAAGVNPVEMTYIPSDGGGEATQALLNGTAHASASGYPDSVDQIESGRLRALAIVAPEPVEGIDIPTTPDLGYDVTLSNWRILVGAPGLTEEEHAGLEDIVLESLQTPEWTDAVDRYRWTENVIYGEELEEFLSSETDRITQLYEELGQ